MSYGIQVINNSNITIIDSDYSNYVIYATGTTTGTGGGSDWVFSIAIPNIAGVQLYISSPTVAGAFYCNNWGGISPGVTCTIVGITTASTLNYVIVVPSSAIAAPSSDYGINIYRADGSLAFTSQYDYMVLGAAITFEYTATASIFVSGNAYVCASVLTTSGWWEYYYNIYGNCSDPSQVYNNGSSYLACEQNGGSFSFYQLNTMSPPATPCSSAEYWLYNNVTVPFLIL